MPDENDGTTDEAGTSEESDQQQREPLGEPGIQALQAERARVKALEKELRGLKPLAAKAQQLEDERKTAEERANERAAAAEAKTQAALTRAAGAELRALAAPDFANADDAARFIDVTEHLDADGNLDRKSAAAAIKVVLDGRTYLRRQGTRAPAYQAGQGAGGDPRPSSASEQMNAALRQALGRT